MRNSTGVKKAIDERYSFAQIEERMDMPSLIAVQKDSYKMLLEHGIREVVDDFRVIDDAGSNYALQIEDFELKLKEGVTKPPFSADYDPDIYETNYSTMQCKNLDATYSAKFLIKCDLIDKSTMEIIQSSTIQVCDFPLMTSNGTFIINGAERVILSQLVRSPGSYFSMTRDKTGKELFAGNVIPGRGSWLEYETDSNDCFYVKIDKNKKIPITQFIMALGYVLNDSDEETNPFRDVDAVLKYFENDIKLIQTFNLKDDKASISSDALLSVYRNVRPGDPPILVNASQYLANMFYSKDKLDLTRVGRYKYNKKLGISERLVGCTLAEDVVLSNIYGELIETIPAGTRVDAALAEKIRQAGVSIVRVEDTDIVKIAEHLPSGIDPSEVYELGLGEDVHNAILNPLLDKHGADKEEFLAAVAKNAEMLRPSPVVIVGNGMVDIRPYLPESVGEISDEELENAGIREDVSYEVLRDLLMEFNGGKEDLLRELKQNADALVPKVFTFNDIIASISYMLNLGHEIGRTDDIDHLGNRRVRCVGELVQNQLRVGFMRMERAAKERMIQTPTLEDLNKSDEAGKNKHKLSPQSFINTNQIKSLINEFFASSPLSQFMDQTNPLAELTHKRKITAVGPGGISRERASYEVRDVHYSHYGRLCPIETPEGGNIGLITSLATFARINKYGFIESPFRRVDKATGKVLDDIVYMTADVEDNYRIAQANEPLDKDSVFIAETITVRKGDDFMPVSRNEVDFMDVSPKMVVSVATAMIPFLANDDANRALMGSNMQKQAVPLIVSDPPIVGTGMEYRAAVDSGVVVLAKRSGTVSEVSSDMIKITPDEGGEPDEYQLIKFERSNQGTCINQRPIVDLREHVEAGDVIADGPATSNGEISLGKNALIGFMTWEGYNYEDAVLLNENLVKNDVYTSIHIMEYPCEAREQKLGPDEITREIPNVSEDALKNLDEHGIIRIGAEVRAGDILIGKVSPKGESEVTAEEKLLRAIFGERAKEVRDTSTRLPNGEYGIVVDVHVYVRENSKESDENVLISKELPAGVLKKVVVFVAQKRKIMVGDKMAGRHGNKGVVSKILPQEDMPFLPDGTPLDIVLNPLGVPSRMNIGQVLEVSLGIAAKKLGKKIMTPVFDGAHEEDIIKWLEEAGLQTNGKTILRDGRTGREFDNPVTVGIMYFLKLHHLVDEKIHARSTGPYALVTQQPLGGKAQGGGQRFGEMEVWALEAYGAAYTLQEVLTTKSDDILGRTKSYEAMVKGENVPAAGIPESFKVLIKEFQSLCIDIRVYDKDDNEIDLTYNYDDDPSATADEAARFASEQTQTDLPEEEGSEGGDSEQEAGSESYDSDGNVGGEAEE